MVQIGGSSSEVELASTWAAIVAQVVFGIKPIATGMSSMGNPHPTKSKPIKIGRKHSGAKSEKFKQKRRNTAIRNARLKLEKKRKYDRIVRDYFLGLRDNIPVMK